MTAHEQGVGRPGDWARKHYKQMIVVRAGERAFQQITGDAVEEVARLVLLE